MDLNLKNVLLGPDGEALVIDLDRCRIGEGPAPWPVVRENLLRLHRSWWKLRAAEPASAHPRDPLRFLRAYAGPDRELRRRVRAAGRARTYPLRSLLWRLRPPRLA